MKILHSAWDRNNKNGGLLDNVRSEFMNIKFQELNYSMSSSIYVNMLLDTGFVRKKYLVGLNCDQKFDIYDLCRSVRS